MENEHPACITISSRRHAPLEAAPFLKGAELEVVIVVVERTPSALTPVPVSVTRYEPLQYKNEKMTDRPQIHPFPVRDRARSALHSGLSLVQGLTNPPAFCSWP